MVKYFIPIVAICLLFLSSRISIDKLLNAVGMPLQIYSEQVSELSLYLPDKAKASYSLALGESVLYQYSGTTGKWLYGVYQGKTVIVKDEQRRLGYRLPTIGIIEQKSINAYDRILSVIPLYYSNNLYFFKSPS